MLAVASLPSMVTKRLSATGRLLSQVKSDSRNMCIGGCVRPDDVAGFREKGDSPHLCEAPFGPFRQMGTVPFFLRSQTCGGHRRGRETPASAVSRPWATSSREIPARPSCVNGRRHAAAIGRNISPDRAVCRPNNQAAASAATGASCVNRPVTRPSLAVPVIARKDPRRPLGEVSSPLRRSLQRVSGATAGLFSIDFPG